MTCLVDIRGAGVRFMRETQTAMRVRRVPFWALRGVDLQLHDGERLAVVGANGSGKTTLMRLIAGVFEPDEGSIERSVQPTLLSLGGGFNQALSGRENIFINGALLGVSRRHIRSLLDRIIAFADIGAYLDAPIRSYSSGMRVRLAFAIASHLKPDVLLMDETLATGDRFFREKARARLLELASECRALVLVSHQEQSIRRLCDRAIWLDGGRVKLAGDVETVLAAYQESRKQHGVAA